MVSQVLTLYTTPVLVSVSRPFPPGGRSRSGVCRREPQNDQGSKGLCPLVGSRGKAPGGVPGQRPGLRCVLVRRGMHGRPRLPAPDAPVPAAFKELTGWKPAHPEDDADKGAWWAIYHDPELDRLERMVEVSNQTVKEFEAQYRNAVALVAEARASLFPTVGLTVGASRSGGCARQLGREQRRRRTARPAPSTARAARIRGTWMSGAGCAARWKATSPGRRSVPPIWRMRSCRRRRRWPPIISTCAPRMRWPACCAKPRTRTSARCRSPRTSTTPAPPPARDVVTARAQLQSTEAQLVGVGVQRQQYEHAIAMLTGHAPADLTIAPAPLASDGAGGAARPAVGACWNAAPTSRRPSGRCSRRTR